MRIISLVPSWTETLLEAGLPVVGRTRYCIHPASLVDSIPIIGGTKKVDWQKLESLKPDLLILDKEENPKEIADQAPCPLFVSHVLGVSDVARDLGALASLLKNQQLDQWAQEWREIIEKPLHYEVHSSFPGLLRWVLPPNQEIPRKLVYVVWRKPWMCIRARTFIGSVLQLLGFEIWEPPAQAQTLYPEFDILTALREGACVLLSSEPYDFVQKLVKAEFPSGVVALVDGEKFSWFGLRSLRFLQSVSASRQK